MTIFRVETYVIKPEKQEEYMAIMKKWVAYIKKNKEKCQELKSWRLFSQMIGGNSGGYVEMGEFESLADFEKFMHRTFHGRKESITTIVSGFTNCVVPGTYSVNIWNSVM
jgi:YesN/AraC family two-component response regulator